MLVYLAVMIFCCILLYAMRNNNNKIIPLALSFGAIWLMVSLQDGWGGDHDAYEMLFDQIQGLGYRDLLLDDSHGEIGYKLLMSMMPSSHAGMVLGMGIWCYAMAFFFYHFVPQKWWFFAILFVFLDRAILMGMIASYSRMAIACSFLIFAVYNVLKNKRLRAIAIIILAALFHKSVLFMIPLVFVGKNYNKIQMPIMIGIFVFITLFSMLSPSSWIGFVESIVSSVDALDNYSIYFEETPDIAIKGLVLLILFYWIYLLSKGTQERGLGNAEYLVMYYALIRIAFDLLPAFGLSTRFFYFIDIYFLAGMMALMNRLPKNDIHKWGIAVTLLLIFWFTGFRVYASSVFYLQHWATYNFIF